MTRERQPTIHAVLLQAISNDENTSGLAEHLQGCVECRDVVAYLAELEALATKAVALTPRPPDGLSESILADTASRSAAADSLDRDQCLIAKSAGSNAFDGDGDHAALTVLLAEDDPHLARMYALRLQLDGYRVEVASDGLQAVQKAIGDPPNIILLDIRMPKLDGLAVLERVKSDNRMRAIPVVVLSGYGEPALVARGMKLGAVEYIVKSEASPARVAARVADWIGHRSGRPQGP
jgi:CheY-like chemotaxis protein